MTTVVRLESPDDRDDLGFFLDIDGQSITLRYEAIDPALSDELKMDWERFRYIVTETLAVYVIEKGVDDDERRRDARLQREPHDPDAQG